MDKHYGQIVEYTIRRKNYNLSQLALKLRVNRRTVYNWFGQAYLKPDIIFSIGMAMNHDFAVQFPELFRSADFNSPQQPVYNPQPDGNLWQQKYIRLLEKYNELLSQSIKVV